MQEELCFYQVNKEMIEFFRTIGLDPNQIKFKYYLRTIDRLLFENGNDFDFKMASAKNKELLLLIFEDIIKKGMTIDQFCLETESNKRTVKNGLVSVLSALKGNLTNEGYIERERRIASNIYMNQEYFYNHCYRYNLNPNFILYELIPKLSEEGFNYPQIATILVRYYGIRIGEDPSKIINDLNKKTPRQLLNSYKEIHKAFYDGEDIFATPHDGLFLGTLKKTIRPNEWGAKSPHFYTNSQYGVSDKKFIH